MKTLGRLLAAALLLVALAFGAALWWLHHPLPMPGDATELVVEPGRTPRGIAEDVAAAGVGVDPRLLWLWFRVSGQARQMRAGNYALDRATTPRKLLAKLVRGDEAMRFVTVVEGWNLRQLREALARAEQLRPESAGLSDTELMAALGRPGVPAEGRFFPDTYGYSRGSSDMTVLRRALAAMDRHLEAAWAQRAPGLPLTTPSDALTLASIVEKETGRAADRAQIAGVFVNRLKAGMPLQTDPTVIYGLGPAFDGNLRRRDLQADTPWNTYTRTGLPPTPIAMPGRAALFAATHPAATRSLYFVSRGDGSSHFSESLAEHNRAVDQYQRGAARGLPPAAVPPTPATPEPAPGAKAGGTP